MNEIFGSYITPDKFERLDYSEKDPDSFNTKLFFVGDGEPGPDGSMVVVSRDAGSAAALSPVVKILEDQKRVGISVLTDGRAEGAIKGQFETVEHTPENPLQIADSIPAPNLILADVSSEQGLETYLNATFENVPLVLIEDYYSNTKEYLKAVKERPGLRMPVKICVMDEEAKNIILSDHPELSEVVEVTGQPAFDSIANEDVKGISEQVRAKLGLAISDKIVAFMSTDDVNISQITKIAEILAQAGPEYTLAFRKHPADNTTYEQYFEMLEQLGIKCVDTREFATKEVSAASDLVITTWSTAGIEAIYRKKPTIHILDDQVLDVPPKHMESELPPVKFGASLKNDDVAMLPDQMEGLLDTESEVYQRVMANMAEYYPADGKNAERVVQVLQRVLQSAQETASTIQE